MLQPNTYLDPPAPLVVPVSAALVDAGHPLDRARLRDGWGLTRAATADESRQIGLGIGHSAGAAVFNTCCGPKAVVFGQDASRPMFLATSVLPHSSKLAKRLAREWDIPRRLAVSVLAYGVAKSLAPVELFRLTGSPPHGCGGCNSQCIFGPTGPLVSTSPAGVVADAILRECRLVAGALDV